MFNKRFSGIYIYIFFYLLLKLINKKLLLLAKGFNNIYLNFNLNRKLVVNSYILKNLNFEKRKYYLGYNKLMPVLKADIFMKDTLYFDDYNLRYLDIYRGLKTNEICELNLVINKLFADRLWVERSLKDFECKKYWPYLEELNLIFKKSFKILKKIIYVLKKNNIDFEIKVLFQEEEPIVEFELKNYLSKYIENMDVNKKDISFYNEINELKILDWNYTKIFVRESNEKGFTYCWLESTSYFWEKYEKDPKECVSEISKEYIYKIFLKELLNKKDI